MNDMNSRLVPQPRKLTPQEGQFAWGSDITLIVAPDNEKDQFAAQTLVEACAERKVAAPKVLPTQDFEEATRPRRIFIGDPSRNWPLCKALEATGIKIPAEIADEGYVLIVSPEQILVVAYSSPGVYYGVQTLIQLLPRAGETAIPALRIEDWTDIRQRGISIDLFAGDVYTLDMWKKTIQRLAHYKLNLLVPYFEDAFEFPSHPDIGAGRDRMTFAEAQELVAFGRMHHVEILPCYDSPGHIGHTLRHPAYQYLAEGETHQSLQETINVTHPDTYPLLRDLYTDLCKAFPFPYLYVSGDECLQIGREKSKAVRDQVGPANLHLRHVKILREILLEHGKRMALASDPFEPDFFKAFGLQNYGIEAMEQLPRDVIIGPWHYGRVDEFEFGTTLNEMGFDQYLWTSNAAFKRLYPNQIGAAENVETFVPYGHNLKVLGVVHSDWNIPGENTFSEYNWPSIIHFSDWVWPNEGRPWKEVLPALLDSFYGAGAGVLAKTVLFLSSANHYFHWADPSWGEPEYKLFFQDMSPTELDEKNLGLLNDFRHDLKEPKEALAAARKAAVRNAKDLDFYDFCLAQYEVMADLVEARHLMTKSDAESKKRLKALLQSASTAYPALTKRYEDLWLRVSKPLGLEPNVKRFEGVAKAIDEALANL